jgi:small subunit ribosomal protein S2
MSKITTLKKLLNTRGFLGHKVGKNLGIRGLHPSMTHFLLGNRKNLSIIDINFTIKNIIKTLYIILSILNRNGHILIVNTNPEISNLVHHFAMKTNNFGKYFSFCNCKWVGGTLTNWDQISNSIATFISFSERFGTFIKRNNIHFPRYRKLKKSFQGFGFSHQDSFSKVGFHGVKQDSYFQSKTLASLENKRKLNLKKPDILLIINPNENRNVLYEAKKLNIPVIALTDTNSDLSFITYPIPVNNNSPFFVQYYFSWIIRLLKSKTIQ